MVVCIINAIIFYFSRTRLGHCEINVIDFINTVLTDIFCILHILINVPLIVRIIALITLCIKKQFFFFFWKNLLQMHAYRRSNVFPSKIIFNYFIRFFPNVTIILSYNILLAPNILQEFSRDPSHFSRPWTIFLHSRNPPFFCSDIQPLFFFCPFARDLYCHGGIHHRSTLVHYRVLALHVNRCTLFPIRSCSPCHMHLKHPRRWAGFIS